MRAVIALVADLILKKQGKMLFSGIGREVPQFLAALMRDPGFGRKTSISGGAIWETGDLTLFSVPLSAEVLFG